LVYDCFMVNDEMEVVEIRLHEMADVADVFVIAEMPLTYSGLPKPLHFTKARERFAAFSHKIIHLVVDDPPTPLDEHGFRATFGRAPGSSASDGAWLREIHQRNALARGFRDAAPDDVIIMADADEIPRAEAVLQHAGNPGCKALAMELYHHFLNTKLPDYAPHQMPWVMARMNHTAGIDAGVHLQRMAPVGSFTVVPRGGWHFSSCYGGDVEKTISKSVSGSHFADAGADEWRDQLARDGLYLPGLRRVEIDEGFPRYVRENLARFSPLILTRERQLRGHSPPAETVG
jgi:beta-1,4-mannosyl-glycoprotein beta-1,4-N-acetylglucosaminyltransferase